VQVGLGTRVATLMTVDTHGSTSRDTALIKVVDTKPPTFPALPTVINSLCSPDGQSATIPTPAVTDACGPGFTVNGAVITSNGKTLSPPIPIQGGRVQVPVGTHVVRWTAVDQSGNSATATQTLSVRPAIEASNSIALEDRAITRVVGGGFAMLGNIGTGTVTGVESQTGSIVTRGSVFLRDRAIVNGNILAGGTITTQNLTTVTGSATQNATVSLPAGRNLAGVVFPTTNAGAITLAPDAARTLAPGAYAVVTVNSRATLTLTAGTYTFESLTLEPQSRLNLNQSAGAIQLFVKTSVIDRGDITPAGGVADAFLLGYAGTASLTVERPFPAGTIVAPSAAVIIGSLGSTAFRGQLFAKDIQIRPDATLTCVAVPGASP